jgi:hypothetical protein
LTLILSLVRHAADASAIAAQPYWAGWLSIAAASVLGGGAEASDNVFATSGDVVVPSHQK